MLPQQPPLKICYVLKRFPRLSQTFVLNELLELQRQGAELTIVALKDDQDALDSAAPQLEQLNAQIYYLPAPEALAPAGWQVRVRAADGQIAAVQGAALRGRLTPKAHALLLQAALIAPLIQQLGISHIHAHFASAAASAASYIAALTGLPFSFTAHAHDIFHADVDKTQLARTIAQARFVVTVSDYNKAYLDRLLASAGRAGRVVRLYNGIDLGTFMPQPAPREPDLVVGVGRLVAKKGFADLIEACRLLLQRGHPVRCAIVGEGEQRAALEQQIAQAGLQEYVALLGAQPQTVVMRLVARATALALPCVVGADGDRDGMPTVLLEAMALGTPVISTDIAGIPELIEHGRSGWLVPPYDPTSLAGAIERLRETPTLRARLSQAALARVRADFDLARNVRQLSGLFLNEGERR